MYNDYLSNPTAERFSAIPSHFLDLERSSTLLNKEVEKAFVTLSAADFKAKVGPSTLTSRKLGNMYSASLYGALASLLDTAEPAALQGKRIAMYSYGSGLAASFFTLRVKGDTSEIHQRLKLKEQLEQNQVRSCEEFVAALKVRLLFLSIGALCASDRTETDPAGDGWVNSSGKRSTTQLTTPRPDGSRTFVRARTTSTTSTRCTAACTRSAATRASRTLSPTARRSTVSRLHERGQ